MSVKEYSLKKHGKNYKISDHFELREMACKDGSDKVLVSTELMKMLEKLRSYGGFTISINSGYRTKSYNKSINGASNSQHLYGTAVDALVYKDGRLVSPKYICCIAQDLGFKGIGAMHTATHLDMRSSGTYRGDENKGGKKDYSNNVGGNFYSYFGISKEEIKNMKVKQEDDEDMTQEQFNKMADQYFKDLNARTDISSYAKDSIAWAKNDGISDGTMPKGYCTREQVVSMLHRFLKLIRG